MYTLLYVEYFYDAKYYDSYSSIVYLDINTMKFIKAPLFVQFMGRMFGQYSALVDYGFGYEACMQFNNDLNLGVVSGKHKIVFREKQPWFIKLLWF